MHGTMPAQGAMPVHQGAMPVHQAPMPRPVMQGGMAPVQSGLRETYPVAIPVRMPATEFPVVTPAAPVETTPPAVMPDLGSQPPVLLPPAGPELPAEKGEKP
jgi:hypothetical protein